MPRKKETFMLVSLQEDKAKKLAQIVASDTSRKILNYLTEKEATESQLAKELGLPMSTIHYNLKHLIKGGLIESEEFHYSEKGKEVMHYRLANKYIIIAPKSTFGLKEKLRNILPVALVTAGAAFVIQFMQKYFPSEVTRNVMSGAADETVRAAPMFAAEKVAEVAMEADLAVEGIAMDSAAAPTVNETIPQVIEIIKDPSVWHSPVLWFVVGSVSALGLYILFSWLFRKK